MVTRGESVGEESIRSPGLATVYTSPAAHVVKNLLQCRLSKFLSWVSKIPWRRAWQPTPAWRIPMDRGAWLVTESWTQLSD